ncbi:hypothetical protein FO519_005008 [Halicephalobus sp. NKZ332]|nr:hypothetical protein FO519_005008 [Halicephalobus sp. NKZ332]
MSIQVYAEYFEILPLYILWHECLNVAFTVSNITLTTASFLLVSATFERYLQTIRMGKLLRFVSRHRTTGVFISFLGGILFRGSVFFEIQVFYKPECEGFASTGVMLSELVTNPYYEIFRFWIRRISTIFVPFFVLAYCNAMIVYSLQENQRNKMVKTLILYMTMGHNGEIVRLRSRVRAATRMLIIVVSCYLFANIIDVVIAFLEYTVPEALSNTVFYTVTTDFSSLLSVLSSALRPPIYIANDKLIRQEVLCKIHNIYYSLCSSSQASVKHKAFLSEKRNLIYNQLEKSTLTSPAVNSTPENKVNCKISIDSTRTRSGIGSLIMARASVVSSMNDSWAVNYDIERCTAIYEKAIARKSSSVSIEDTSVCENPAGLDRRVSTEDYRMSRKLSRQIMKKKMSIQTQISINEQDEEEKEELPKVKEDESTASSLEDISSEQNNSEMGGIRSWCSEL